MKKNIDLKKVLSEIEKENDFWCDPTIMFYPEKGVAVDTIEQELSMHGDANVLEKLYKMGFIKISKRYKTIYSSGCIEISMIISINLKGLWKLSLLERRQ